MDDYGHIDWDEDPKQISYVSERDEEVPLFAVFKYSEKDSLSDAEVADSLEFMYGAQLSEKDIEIARSYWEIDEELYGVLEDHSEDAKHSTENLHHFARQRYKNRREMRRNKLALELNGVRRLVNYDGEMGKVQSLVEDQAESRDFRIRYAPQKEDTYRNTMELQVVQSPGSEQEMYVGMEDDVLYVGSTVSAFEREFDAVDKEFETAVEQELNNLVY
jgi:hypothetical protein